MEKGVDYGLISQAGGILQLIKVIAVQLSLAANFGAIPLGSCETVRLA